jgi:hypothetical protein
MEAVRAVALYVYGIVRGDDTIKKEYKDFLYKNDETILKRKDEMADSLLNIYLVKVRMKHFKLNPKLIKGMLQKVDSGNLNGVRSMSRDSFDGECYNLALILAIRCKEFEKGRDLGDKKWRITEYVATHLPPPKPLQCEGCAQPHTKPLQLCSICRTALFCSEKCIHKCKSPK